MAKYSNTKAKINEKITTNSAQAITGNVLNEVLQTMVDSLGADYQFGGLVQPGSAFTAGEQPVVFLATTPGTYTNFGGIVVADGEVALLVWSGTAWSKQTPDIATRTEVSQLGQKLYANDIDISGLPITNGVISTVANTWYEGSGACCFLPIIAGKTYRVKNETEYTANVAVLATDHWGPAGATPSWATGYTGVIQIPAGEEIEIATPVDAVSIYIRTKDSSNNDISPRVFSSLEDFNGRIKNNTDAIESNKAEIENLDTEVFGVHNVISINPTWNANYGINVEDGSSVYSTPYSASNKVDVSEYGGRELTFTSPKGTGTSYPYGMVVYDENNEVITSFPIIPNADERGLITESIKLPLDASKVAFTVFQGQESSFSASVNVNDNGISDNVESLEDAVFGLDETTPLVPTWTANQAINIEDGTDTYSTPYSASNKLEISQYRGRKLVYKRPKGVGASYPYGMVIYDEFNAVINAVAIRPNATERGMVDYEVTIPAQAKYIAFTIFQGQESLFTATIYGRAGGLSISVYDLEREVNGWTETNELSSTWNTNKAIKVEDGTMIYSTPYSATNKIDISRYVNQKLSFKRPCGTGASYPYGMVIYGASDVVLYSLPIRANASVRGMVDYSVVIPEGAKKVAFTVFVGQETDFSVIVENGEQGLQEQIDGLTSGMGDTLILTEPEGVVASAWNYILKNVSEGGVQKLKFSNDLGETWMEAANTFGDIVYVHFFSNGAVLFATANKCYHFTDIADIQESTLLDYDGTPYVSNCVLDFFQNDQSRNDAMFVNGKEIVVWGNYSLGYSYDPNYVARMWYSPDYGETVKCAIKFGTTVISGETTAVRHTHGAFYNKFNEKFLILTGDFGTECQLIEGNYDIENDAWTFNKLGEGDNFKFGDVLIREKFVYLVTDYTGAVETYPRGILRCPYSMLNDFSKYEYICKIDSSYSGSLIGALEDEHGNKLLFPDGTGAGKIWYCKKNFKFIQLAVSEDVVITNVGSPNYNGDIYVRKSLGAASFPFKLDPMVNLTQSMRNSGCNDFFIQDNVIL